MFRIQPPGGAFHPRALDLEANVEHLGDLSEARRRYHGSPVASPGNQAVLQPHQRFAHGALGAAELGSYVLFGHGRTRGQLGQNNASFQCVIQRVCFAELQQRASVGGWDSRVCCRRLTRRITFTIIIIIDNNKQFPREDQRGAVRA
jgi:hypothetical protein